MFITTTFDNKDKFKSQIRATQLGDMSKENHKEVQ